MCKQLGWQHISFLVVDDSYGSRAPFFLKRMRLHTVNLDVAQKNTAHHRRLTSCASCAGRSFKQDLETSASHVGINVAVSAKYLFSDVNTIRKGVAGIRESGVRVIIVVAFEDDIELISRVAEEEGVRDGYTWITSGRVSCATRAHRQCGPDGGVFCQTRSGIWRSWCRRNRCQGWLRGCGDGSQCGPTC